jgi:hypothetical protein
LKVLPLTKNRFHRLSLICKSNLPPSLQALGGIQLDDIDEDVISVVGNAPRASATTSSGLAIGIHGARIRWKEIWKSGSNIWKAKKSGMVGRPTVPDFSQQKVKKSAL